MKEQVVIIGGGPAGLAAALAVKETGIDKILVLERDTELGGILNQCIHNGFGLHTFKEELTGPEYAARYVEKVKKENIPYFLETIVIDIAVLKNGNKMITAMNKDRGMLQIETEAVILAMGCRERPRGALNIPGTRPAGIYSAGTAQRFVNREGRMPGKEIVILGSGDIGLIMARRMTLEGAKVKVVAELMPYSGGLKRNIAQCLDDYDIPLKLSHTVIDIKGTKRVTGVVIAKVDENLKPISGTEEEISCDTLLLSCGLIPENELSEKAGVKLNSITSGPIVKENFETNVKGIFACGNVLHVHDLVDYVSKEAMSCGVCAAQYVLYSGSENQVGETEIFLEAKQGVRYTVPSILRPNLMEENTLVRFRVSTVFKDVCLVVYFNDTPVMKLNKKVLAPGEMEQLFLPKEKVISFPNLKTITLRIEQEVGEKIWK